MYCIALYCIVFIHFYNASHSLSLSEALPTSAIDTVGVYTWSVYVAPIHFIIFSIQVSKIYQQIKHMIS